MRETAAIWLAKPGDLGVGAVIRLLPDLLRLFKRVAAGAEQWTVLR